MTQIISPPPAVSPTTGPPPGTTGPPPGTEAQFRDLTSWAEEYTLAAHPDLDPASPEFWARVVSLVSGALVQSLADLAQQGPAPALRQAASQ